MEEEASHDFDDVYISDLLVRGDDVNAATSSATPTSRFAASGSKRKKRKMEDRVDMAFDRVSDGIEYMAESDLQIEEFRRIAGRRREF